MRDYQILPIYQILPVRAKHVFLYILYKIANPGF